jgi:hypothetical protein
VCLHLPVDSFAMRAAGIPQAAAGRSTVAPSKHSFTMSAKP